MTFKTNLLPQADKTYELGSSSLGWKITKLNAKKSSSSTEYGPGTNGQVLLSNGSAVYWGDMTSPVTDSTVAGWGYIKSDTKVTQNAAITTAGEYPILLSKTTATTAETDTINKQGTLLYNPNTKVLSLSSADDTKGAIYLNGQNHAFGLINGSGGTNYGIYDNTTNYAKWVLVDNETHNWRIKANAERVDYLTSPTAANTAGKTVSTSEGGPHNFTLSTGTSIYIQFTNTNTVNNPTLNISGSGAKEIWHKGVRVVYQGLANNIIYHMIYDGSKWQIVNSVPTRVGECTTGGSTAAKVVTCPGFIKYVGSVAYVRFTNTNTHATPTLNINSTGAANIMWENSTTGNAYKIRSNKVYGFIYTSQTVNGTNTYYYRPIEDVYQHEVTRGVSAVAATYYTQDDWDAYVAANGTEPTWAVGDQKTAAVAATNGIEILVLGNTITSNTNNGMNGQLALYGTGQGFHRIMTDLTGNTHRDIHLRNYSGSQYLAFTSGTAAVGSTSQPVYVDASGKITAITGAIANNTTGSAATLTTTRKIDGINFNGSADVLHYGTCSTAAGTTAKTVAITGFVLTTGAVFYVKFSNGNTANSPTLNVNSTGAKSIYFQNGTRLETASSYPDYLQSGKIYQFVYDGTNYVLINNPNTLELYEKRSSTTSLNKTAITGGAGAMFHMIASSSTSATDNGKPPMGDANVLQMNWDNNGGYDAQLAISTSANRMEFRDQISTKKAWREVVTSTPGTAAGGTTQPVYISTTGVATAIGYTIAKSVPSDAKFTDTTYSAPTTSAAGLVPALPSSNGTSQYLRGDGSWAAAPVTSVAGKTGAVTLGTLTIGDVTYNGSGNATVSIADLGIASTTTFWGITDTNLSDGSTTTTVHITVGPTTGNRTVSASTNGVVVMEASSGEEYIWTGSKWNMMGLASSYALASHVHGNMNNAGVIASDTTVASGQHLMVTDSNNKVSRSSLTFGTDTSKYLRNDGTWQTVSTADEKVKQTAKTDNVNYKLLFTTSASPSNGGAAEAAYDANITINPSTHKITATTFAGNLTGNVTGNVTGNLTGNVTGNVNGDITGNLTGDVVGNVLGNVEGDLTGNVSGNVTGNVIGDVTGDVTGNADSASAANITTTANAIAYYTNTAGTFGSLASGNGALYATSANGSLQFGTLQVAQGGTGATTFTSNRILKGNGTNAIAASGISIDASNNITGAVGITASGVISTTNTTASTSTTTGAIKSAGGIAAAGQITGLRLAANGSNTSYSLYVNGSSYLNGNSTVKAVFGTSNSTYGETLPASGSEGQIFFQLADGVNTASKITTVAATANTRYYLVGTEGTGSYDPYVAVPNASGTQNTGGVYFHGSSGVLFGAAWNDYAEYRQKKNIDGIPYGKVVIENGDDTVSFATERLQPCGQIISDTFGFILGPEENGLPIALCGRVLAYPYENRNEFNIGDAVCTGPNGTVSKMTREEIREWPDRILGYVSSIPQYDIWEEKNIVVDGRIWIKVK